MNDAEEKAYEAGSRMAWRNVLHDALRALGYTSEFDLAKAIAERESAVAALRAVCRDHGDNEWPNDLCLADVVSKHLHDPLERANEGVLPLVLVDRLNKLIEDDHNRADITALLDQRVPRLDARERLPLSAEWELSFLGLLNGIVTLGHFAGCGVITAERDPSGKLVRFKALKR